MKSKNLKAVYYLLVLVLVVVFNSCDDNSMVPIETDGVAPGKVSNVIHENLPGAVRFVYTLPSDPDLLFVEATFETGNAKKMSFKSSYYTNNLLIEGFSDTTEVNVELYAVDRSGNKSELYTENVKPLLPPFHHTLQTLVIEPDFGGITVYYDNPSEANLAIGVLTPDSIGDYVTAKIEYTSRAKARFSVRGYSSDEREFELYVRDKWENYSDTISVTVLPLREEKLDKLLWEQFDINSSDAAADMWGGIMEALWDDFLGSDATPPWGAHSGATNGLPPMFWTIDLGTTSRLTRSMLWGVLDDKHMYNDQTPRFYEIWGSTDPAIDGSFDGWFLMAEHEMIKPSGLPVGQLNEDDRTAARTGDEIVFDTSLPAVRYIRIKSTKNWNNNTNMVIGEFTLFGVEAE